MNNASRFSKRTLTSAILRHHRQQEIGKYFASLILILKSENLVEGQKSFSDQQFLECFLPNLFYFNIFTVFHDLMSDLGSLRTNKHTETRMRAVSERSSKTTDLNLIFACFLVAPLGKRDYETAPRPGAFTASLETMCSQGVATLALALS
jgi:hypothetical protein